MNYFGLPLRATSLLKSGVALSAVMLGSAAWAQTQGEIAGETEAAAAADPAAPPTAETGQAPNADGGDDGEIVVTGTLVRGIAPPGTNVVGVSQEEVRTTGAVTTAQLLQTIPQLGSFNELQFPNAADNTQVVNRPNLRNLPSFNNAGGSSTLVLLDGHRIVGAGLATTSPDPDIVPPGAIERLEIVPDGGSAVYGSDAVAGVLNFITRRRFSGVELSGRYGFADDYAQWDVNATAGHQWDSGGVFVSYNHSKHDAIFGRDRDFVRTFPQSFSQLGTNIGLLGIQCSPGNVVIGSGATQQIFALPFNTISGPAPVSGTANQCDTTDDASFYPQEKRDSVFAGVSQDIADGVTLDVRGFYTNRRLEVTGGRFRGSATVTASNPGFASHNLGTASQTVNFAFGPVDASQQDISLKTWGITPTLTAKLGGSWQLRMLGSMSWSTTGRTGTALNTTALQNAVNAGLFNPYDPASSNPAALALITGDEAFGLTKQKLADIRAVVDGDLFTLPGGAVKLAAGVEWYREQFRKRTGQTLPGREEVGNSAICLQTGTGAAATCGTPGAVTILPARTALRFADLHRDVEAAFGELVVPIFGPDNAVPGLRELTVSVAGRYDVYSDFGGTFNPKVGVTYRPVSWWKFRGSWGKSFVAPSLADHPATDDVTVFSLPSFAGFLPPAALRQPGGPYPVPGSAGAPGTNVLAIRGNAPDIQPQKARTISVGFDIEPPFVEGLNLGLTYYNILFKGLIGLPPIQNIGEFYGSFGQFVTLNPTLAQVQDILNSATVPIAQFPVCSPLPTCYYAILDIRKNNLGDAKLSGLDFEASYRRRTGFGSVNFAFNGTHALTRKQSAGPGLPFRDQLKFNASKFQFRALAGASIGNLYSQVTLNHRSGFKLSPAIGFEPQTKVDSFDVIDLFFRYDVNGQGALKDLSFTLNVNNLFNQDPPEFRAPSFTASGSGYTNGNTLGRLIQFGIEKKF